MSVWAREGTKVRYVPVQISDALQKEWIDYSEDSGFSPLHSWPRSVETSMDKAMERKRYPDAVLGKDGKPGDIALFPKYDEEGKLCFEVSYLIKKSK